MADDDAAPEDLRLDWLAGKVISALKAKEEAVIKLLNSENSKCVRARPPPARPGRHACGPRQPPPRARGRPTGGHGGGWGAGPGRWTRGCPGRPPAPPPRAAVRSRPSPAATKEPGRRRKWQKRDFAATKKY